MARLVTKLRRDASCDDGDELLAYVLLLACGPRWHAWWYDDGLSSYAPWCASLCGVPLAYAPWCAWLCDVPPAYALWCASLYGDVLLACGRLSASLWCASQSCDGLPACGLLSALPLAYAPWCA